MGPTLASAQVASVSGSWYGRADVELSGMHNNYLTELVIRQKGTRVEGVFGYYFRDKYQSIFIHGSYNPKTREVTILNIPVIYYASNSTVNSIDCNTNFRGVLMNSRAGISTLKGYFYHDERYKYLCPDLKVTYELDRDEQPQPDSVLKVASASTRIWKPQADDYVVDVATPAAAPAGMKTNPAAIDTPAVTQPVSKPAGQPDPAVAIEKKLPADSPRVTGMSVARPDTLKTVATTAPAADPSKEAASPVTAVDSTKAVRTGAAAGVSPAAMAGVNPATGTGGNLTVATGINPAAATGNARVDSVQTRARTSPDDSKKIAESYTRRKEVLNQELAIESDSVRLSFYDNGEIDGDSISVFVNNQVVLMHQELAAKAFNLYLHLDSTREVNEISMFAENLGRIPPNTALMVVTDGKNRYEVFMSSSLTENATIRLKRKRP
jgi:hypothetical protein